MTGRTPWAHPGRVHAEEVHIEPDRPGLDTVFVARPADTAARRADRVERVRFESARTDGPGDPGWAVAWRLRSAAWLVRHGPLLESALRP